MYRNTDKNRAYMKKYMLARYKKRKQEALFFLGNKCFRCPEVKNLQFDHKDRKTKGFTIAKLWSVSNKKFWEEVKKCQLLCQKCHNKKTLKELGKKEARGDHGTISTYRYCKCEKCKNASREVWQKWYQSNKEQYNKERREKRARSSEVELRSFKAGVDVS